MSRNVECEDIIFVVNSNRQSDPMDAGPLLEFWAVRVWLLALFQPSVSTFERLLNDPRAGSWRALWWFAGFSLFNIFLRVMGPFVLRERLSWDLIIASLFITLFFSALIIFSIAIIELIAERIGGQGDFSGLFYGFAAFGAPLTTVMTILDLVQFSSILWLLSVVYGFVLGHIVCQAVHHFGWKRVFISMAPITIGAYLLIGFSAIL